MVADATFFLQYFGCILISSIERQFHIGHFLFSGQLFDSLECIFDISDSSLFFRIALLI